MEADEPGEQQPRPRRRRRDIGTLPRLGQACRQRYHLGTPHAERVDFLLICGPTYNGYGLAKVKLARRCAGGVRWRRSGGAVAGVAPRPFPDVQPRREAEWS